jgi:branched-subunit amino acid transport protein
MDQKVIFYTLLGMLAVTYIPRLLPIAFLSSRDLPDVLVRWLRLIPAAVLSALLLPSILLKDGKIDFSLENQYWWVALPTFLIAIKTRSLYIPVITGMLFIALWRGFF